MDLSVRPVLRSVLLLAGLCLELTPAQAEPPRGAPLPSAAPPAPSGPFMPDPPAFESASADAASAASGRFVPDPPLSPRAPRLGAARGAEAAVRPSLEPELAAALDGPAASAETSDARRRLDGYAHWLGPDGPSVNALQLIERVADAGSHGLDPARYDLDGLREGLRAVFEKAPRRISRERQIASDSPARAALAQRFDRAFSRLAADLGSGVIDARTVQSRYYRERPEPDVAALREAIALGELDVSSALDALAPTDERYARLVETARKLLAERRAGLVRTAVADLGTLRPGDRHGDVMALKRRLIEIGDLSPATVVTPMFDSELLLALEGFQRRNGLVPDGVVDPRTRAALNRSVGEELDDLALSLERWRWMPRELGERHVFVNLPDYRLTVRNGAQSIVDMPVVIGATKHATPTFSRDMSYLEFNPTWTVPSSIVHKELLPLERRRPGYLKSRAFDFMKAVDGRLEVVPHESVTRADLDSRPFPYFLRQRGGPGNALGRMKFMMPNPYSIYLHDTQEKGLFAHDTRAYSHGCIRLSDPERLARLLLQIDGRSAAEADALIASTRTRREALRRPVPTHLAYFTTWVDEHGDVQRRADVYGRDPALREALAANGALPSAHVAKDARGGGREVSAPG